MTRHATPSYYFIPEGGLSALKHARSCHFVYIKRLYVLVLEGQKTRSGEMVLLPTPHGGGLASPGVSGNAPIYRSPQNQAINTVALQARYRADCNWFTEDSAGTHTLPKKKDMNR